MTVKSQRREVPRRVRVREGLSLMVVLDEELDDFEGVERHVRDHGSFPAEPANELMLGLLRPGRRVLDLGAHVGALALPAAALGCEVMAVEACPRSVRRLRAAAELNDFHGLRVVHAAVGDHAGRLEFYPHGAWGHVRQDAERVTTASIEVDAITVDGILREAGWSHVDLVRLSLTGYEVPAIAGMHDLLSSSDAPLLFLRSNGHALHWYQESPRSLLQALERHGYGLHLIDPHASKSLVPVTANDVQADCIVDYLAVKKGQPEPVAGAWTFAPRLSDDESERRIIAARDHNDLNYRCHVARELRHASTAVLSNASVREALKRCRDSAYPKLREAAEWSGPMENQGMGAAVNDAVAPDRARYCTVSVKPGTEVTFAVDPGLEDPIGRHIAGHGFPLEPPIRLTMQLLRPGWRMFDFGAHIGTYSLTAAALGCEVVAVEGSVRNLSLLRAAAERNGFGNLRIVHAVVADKAGQASFFAKHAWGKLVMPGDELSDTVHVAAITGDGLLDDMGWGRVDFIKMDIEGAEPLAIKGMTRLLSGPDAPVILIESNAYSLQSFGKTTSGLLAALQNFGYATFYLDRLTPDRLAPLGPHDLQPDGVADFLAFKALPPALAEWRFEALTQDEVKARLLAHAGSNEWGNRWYAAKIFRDPPPWLSADERVRSFARAFLHDPRREVREIAGA